MYKQLIGMRVGAKKKIRNGFVVRTAITQWRIVRTSAFAHKHVWTATLGVKDGRIVKL